MTREEEPKKVTKKVQKLSKKAKNVTIKHGELLEYETKYGAIKVVLWSRWPSYDFIFGFPAKSHKLYGTEVAFFQYRDTRKKKVIEGFYLDKVELGVMLEGFRKIKKMNH